MFFCPDCHVSNRSDAKFCRKCGKSRSDLERAEVAVALVIPDSEPASSIHADTADSDSVVANSVPDSMEFTAEDVQRDDKIIDYGVASDAPQLSINIEQEESLSAPTDLNTPECPSCWKTLRATDKFCCWCGEAQPNRVLPFLKLCLECSTFLPEKANYCYSCGTDVGYSSRRKVRVPHELFKDEDSEFFPRFDA
jgi:rRNA maturation endonuclease Nob1